ncbi:MAG: hypothetical protein KJ645_13720 [Planctomycetes bacterium]|nr:hypothetical protein [Planctomycetota bacterium]
MNINKNTSMRFRIESMVPGFLNLLSADGLGHARGSDEPGSSDLSMRRRSPSDSGGIRPFIER